MFTLILARGRPERGKVLTLRLAGALGKPNLLVDLMKEGDKVLPIRDWLKANRIETLNVAGPRESGAPGIHAQAKALLFKVLSVGP